MGIVIIVATLPSSVHIAALKKRLSHASSKRRRLIDSAASMELKPHPKVQPIKNPSLPPRDNINNRFGTLNESTMQPQPPPAPNFNHLAKARPLDQRPILQSFSRLPNTGRRFTQSPLSTTQSLSQTLPYDEDLMVTRQGTNRSTHASHMQEKNEAELALQKKMEEECTKRQQEKLQQKEEHRKEEEAWKQREDAKKEERSKAKATAAADGATAQLVFPSNSNPKDVKMEDSNLNKNLFEIMNGGGEEDDPRSLIKNKPKKSNKAADKPVPAAKHAVKGALKAGFKDNHVHNFPRILAEASIELKGESPVQEYIVGLQELLKNGQRVDKNFAFCPMKEGSGTKKIHDPSSIPTNMTLLSGHFKISPTI
jgi:hypothetical protein